MEGLAWWLGDARVFYSLTEGSPPAEPLSQEDVEGILEEYLKAGSLPGIVRVASIHAARRAMEAARQSLDRTCGQPMMTLDLRSFWPRKLEGAGQPEGAQDGPNDKLYKAMDERVGADSPVGGAEFRARDRQRRADAASGRDGRDRKRVVGRPELSGAVVEEDDQRARREFDFTDVAGKAVATRESMTLSPEEGRKLVRDDAQRVARKGVASPEADPDPGDPVWGESRQRWIAAALARQGRELCVV